MLEVGPERHGQAMHEEADLGHPGEAMSGHRAACGSEIRTFGLRALMNGDALRARLTFAGFETE